jgi:hypothetical protein
MFTAAGGLPGCLHMRSVPQMDFHPHRVPISSSARPAGTALLVQPATNSAMPCVKGLDVSAE